VHGLSVDDGVPETFCRYRLQVAGRKEATGTLEAAQAGGPIVISANPQWGANPCVGPASFFVPTSGSTARAKLVQHRHDKLLCAAGRCGERLGLAAADRIALPVPIAHMFGLGAAFLPAILAGASIDIQANANALRYLARERQFNPTVAFLTPSFGDAITRLRKAPKPYRLTVMAGDRLTADLFDRYERLHGCLVNLYGSTELGVIAAGDPADPAHLRRERIGRLMPGVVVRPGCNPAIAGPLCFEHDCGLECYADADGHPISEPDGSYASGAQFCSNDIGRLVDGYLVVQGRADDLVKRDGILIACSEIAAALRAIDGIADAVVLSGAMSRRGRMLIAFCVPAASCEWQPAALRKACLGVLPSRAIPDEFLLLPELPRLASGKINRMALRRRHMTDEVLTDADMV
jgi:acyl-coenzyme A synthetase/AMP-(fatty) acid ligase